MKILVVYLFRKGDSKTEYDKFIESYNEYKTEIPHDLVVYHKGIKGYNTIPNIGRDLYSYRLIAKKEKQYTHFVFFNSHTEIKSKEWLCKLSASDFAATSDSIESFYTNAKDRFSFLNPIRKLLYPEYPNYHVRTNGILISRGLLLEVWPCWLLTKQLCYLFESGRFSLTNRLIKLGITVRVFKGLVSDNRRKCD